MKAAYLSLADCAADLGVDPSTIWRRVVRGELPALKVGRVFRVEPKAFADFKAGLLYVPPASALTTTTPTDSRLIDRARRAH